MPLMVTYHPWFHDLVRSLRKTFYLYAEQQVNQVFTPAPFVSFRSGFGLRNHLVRAKVYPLVRQKGSTCCGKGRCETCFNLNETNTFVTKKVYKINTIFIVIVSVSFTFYLVRCVAYIMLGQLLIDSV